MVRCGHPLTVPRYIDKVTRSGSPGLRIAASGPAPPAFVLLRGRPRCRTTKACGAVTLAPEFCSRCVAKLRRLGTRPVQCTGHAAATYLVSRRCTAGWPDPGRRLAASGPEEEDPDHDSVGMLAFAPEIAALPCGTPDIAALGPCYPSGRRPPGSGQSTLNRRPSLAPHPRRTTMPRSPS